MANDQQRKTLAKRVLGRDRELLQGGDFEQSGMNDWHAARANTLDMQSEILRDPRLMTALVSKAISWEGVSSQLLSGIWTEIINTNNTALVGRFVEKLVAHDLNLADTLSYSKQGLRTFHKPLGILAFEVVRRQKQDKREKYAKQLLDYMTGTWLGLGIMKWGADDWVPDLLGMVGAGRRKESASQALRELMETVCDGYLEDGSQGSLNSTHIIRALVTSGADPDQAITFRQSISKKKNPTETSHPTLTHMAMSYGMTQIAEALVNAGGDWLACWEDKAQGIQWKERLKQMAGVRKSLLAAQGGTAHSPRPKPML